MADPIRSYQNAKKNSDEAFYKLAQIRARILEVASALQDDPRNVSLSGTNSGLPADAMNVLPGRDWPSAEDVQRALAACHQAEIDLRTAWSAIGDHSLLTPPDDPWGALTI
jgi:hypothetical protein